MPTTTPMTRALLDAAECRIRKLSSKLDYSGLTRICDAANLSPTDKVLLSPALQSQFAGLMEGVGLETHANTWAEFRANHMYAEQVLAQANGVRATPLRTLEASCKLYDRLQPGLSDVLIPFVKGDLDRLRGLHSARCTFQENAQSYQGHYDREHEFFDGTACAQAYLSRAESYTQQFRPLSCVIKLIHRDRRKKSANA